VWDSSYTPQQQHSVYYIHSNIIKHARLTMEAGMVYCKTHVSAHKRAVVTKRKIFGFAYYGKGK